MTLAPPPPVTPAVVVRPFAPAAANWLPAHRGLDLAARPGQAVVAPRAGTVAFVGRVAGRPVIAMRASGVRFTFEPVRARVVRGERVTAGQRLGRVGRGGHCDVACLHWGAKVDGAYVDPAAFLPGRAPILKPLRP